MNDNDEPRQMYEVREIYQGETRIDLEIVAATYIGRKGNWWHLRGEDGTVNKHQYGCKPCLASAWQFSRRDAYVACMKRILQERFWEGFCMGIGDEKRAELRKRKQIPAGFLVDLIIAEERAAVPEWSI